jgi:hypothetical protein
MSDEQTLRKAQSACMSSARSKILTRGVREERLRTKRRETARQALCVRVVALDTRALNSDGEKAKEQRAEGEGGREAAKGEHRVLASG